MKYIVQRSLKRPGLIERARTYYIEFNSDGLYLIATGPAGQKPQFYRRNLVTEAAQALTSGIVDRIAQKMEEEILSNEKRIAEGHLISMSNEKKSHFIPTGALSQFSVKQEQDLFRVSIKSTAVSISLLVNEGYAQELRDMENAIGKA